MTQATDTDIRDLTNLISNLDKKLDKLDSKIDNLEIKIDGKLDTINTRLTDRQIRQSTMGICSDRPSSITGNHL
jgi:peptidoglycan hydrolase CwlO-like protein